MNNSLITIALSVYNVEKYVLQSIETIINQTYDNIEILCIDDCSQDNTFHMLTECASRDNRIKLLRQDHNQGLAVSRNLAIEKAHGDYIIMLDGDDLFALDMVEKAYNKIVETDADFVMWDYCTFYDEKDLPELLKSPSGLLDFDPTNKEELLKRPAFTWVKLFKTDFLRKLNVHFPEGLTKQDIPVWWKVVTSTDRIAILPEKLAYYRQQPEATSKRRDKSMFSLAYVMDIVKEQLESDGIYESFKDVFLELRLIRLQGVYDFVEKEYKIEALALARERMDNDALVFLKKQHSRLSFRIYHFCRMASGNHVSAILYKMFIALRNIGRIIIKQ